MVKSQRWKDHSRHFEWAFHHLVRILFVLSRLKSRGRSFNGFREHSTLNDFELRDFPWRVKITPFKMATRDPFGVGEIMRSTWSWACRPRDRCPRSATYTPGYPAVAEGPSLLEDLPRRPPVVPDGNNHRARPSAGNQMSCHAVRPFRYRVKRVLSYFLSSNEGRLADRWYHRRAGETI